MASKNIDMAVVEGENAQICSKCGELKSFDEFHKAVCWHYTNLQPMWANENRNKSDSIPNLFEGIQLDQEFLNKVNKYNE